MEFENVMDVMGRMLIQDLKDLLSLGGSISGRADFRRNDPPLPRRRLVRKALLSRILVLLAMAVSCAVLPDHNPGEDVLQFPLRLDDRSCFCRQGHACPHVSHINDASTTLCAIRTLGSARRYFLVDALYSFLLPPLTRWDASRFLDLAVRSDARDPQCHNKDDCPDRFRATEQAHAFFPMLPLVVRAIANGLISHLPGAVLPPTYEGVAALSALLWNTLCFVLAALALHDLTLGLTQRHLDDIQHHKLPRNDCHRVSYRVFLLFCVNPAGVFFTAAYSESSFAMFHFVGHAMWVRLVLRPGKSPQSPVTLLLGLATVVAFWMAASFTRSNGSILNAAWILLQGLALAVAGGRQSHSTRTISGPFLCATMAIAVLYPMYLHDSLGHARHCRVADDAMAPPWCEAAARGTFSLYRYVQREHWNVGLFRYYTVRQIPNFLLAAPILMLGIRAVADWILTSWSRHRPVANANTNAGRNIVAWAGTALEASVVGWFQVAPSAPPPPSGNAPLPKTEESLLLGPLMLGHYAMLAMVCAIGLFVAHVQISTRLVCSSCPAIYWYMALHTGAPWEVVDHKSQNGRSAKGSNLWRRLILPYCLLYCVLGVVLQPNWLPWT